VVARGPVQIAAHPSGVTRDRRSTSSWRNDMIDTPSTVVDEAYFREADFDGTVTEVAEFGPLPTERSVKRMPLGLSVAGDGACLDAEGALPIADATGDLLAIRVDLPGG
jgi:hypothetical protein